MPPLNPDREAWLQLAESLGRWAAKREFQRLQRLKRGEPEPPDEEEPERKRIRRPKKYSRGL